MILIREANRNDVESILDLWEEFTRTLHQMEPDFFVLKPNAREIYRRLLKKQLKFPEYHIFVAEDEGKLIGYHVVSIRYPSEVFVQAPFGHISDLYLQSTYRGQSIGQKLIEAGKNWFLDMGIEKIDVKTFLTNPKGKAFWEANGFQPFEVAFKNNLEKNLCE